MKQPFPKRVTAAVIAASALATAGASPLDVPNEFASGTPAVAAEVNENFASIEEAVNDNDSRITANETAIAALEASAGGGGPVALDASGAEIGLLVNVDDGTYALDVLTPEGFVVHALSVATGQQGDSVTSLWFASANCSGTAYVIAPPGYVVNAYDVTGTATLHYVEHNAAVVTEFAFGSVTDAFGCQAFAGTVPFASPALPNDSTVTGVPSQPYPAPIRIARPAP